MPYDIRNNLLKIIEQMENKDFRAVEFDLIYLLQAGKTYLLITIGNAAWPIGVTATGIYERSSRERITQESVGRKELVFFLDIDAMVNDTVRVYLTMIKRLMNYKESKTPDGISSGSVVKKK